MSDRKRRTSSFQARVSLRSVRRRSSESVQSFGGRARQARTGMAGQPYTFRAAIKPNDFGEDGTGDLVSGATRWWIPPGGPRLVVLTNLRMARVRPSLPRRAI